MQDLTGGPTRQGQHETLCKRVTVFIESQIKKTGLANGPTLIEHILVRAKLVFQQGRELLNVVYPGLQRVAPDANGRDLLARSEERRVGKECVRRVDLGGRRIIKQKTQKINLE